ncbi:MAG: SDR family oxidoreductase [Deinococcus-Thermus bacterium]|jgi:NAD(P)-dependent dehydrogenase (short-subunit alcohol dehydrogenase family)|nr:SDR family oxidoreductase [Deinococcota bacterium]
MRLDGKIVVITGAGSGMGRAMALRFAKEGATIVGTDIASDRIEEVGREVADAGGVMTPLVTDVSKREDAEKMVRTAIENHGALDVLVNNAGIMDQFQGVATIDDDTWQRVIAVNLHGPMYAMRVAVPFMKEHGGGSIVNVASAAGVGGGAAGAAYTASKHGLVGLTRNTAFTYARMGVRCNAILAGGVETNIQDSIDMSKADQEALQQLGTWHASMPATLKAEDIANLALFLASDESVRISGALIAADAGWLAA